MKRPILLLLWGALLPPVCCLALLAFAKGWFYPVLIPAEWTLDHWRHALGGEMSGSGLKSMILASVVALLSVAAGMPVARVLAAHPRKDRLIRWCYLPYVFSPVVYGFTMQFMYLRTGLNGAFAGLVVGHFLLAFPLAVILFTGYWTSRLSAMEQLVYTLGGSPWQAWRKVLIPVSKGMILVVFFQTFFVSWFDYGLASVIGIGQQPVLTVRAAQYIGESNPHLAAVSAIILILPPLGLLWINRKFVLHRVVAYS